MKRVILMLVLVLSAGTFVYHLKLRPPKPSLGEDSEPLLQHDDPLMADALVGWRGWKVDKVTGRLQWEAGCETATPLGGQRYRLHKPTVKVWPAEQHGVVRLSSRQGEVTMTSPEVGQGDSADIALEEDVVLESDDGSRFSTDKLTVVLADGGDRQVSTDSAVRFQWDDPGRHGEGDARVVLTGQGGLRGDLARNRFTLLPPVHMSGGQGLSRLFAGGARDPSVANDVFLRSASEVYLERLDDGVAGSEPASDASTPATGRLKVSFPGRVNVVQSQDVMVEAARMEMELRRVGPRDQDNVQVPEAHASGGVTVSRPDALLRGDDALWGDGGAWIRLTGKPRVSLRSTDGTSLVTSDRMLYRPRESRVELEGRVEGLFRQGQAARTGAPGAGTGTAPPATSAAWRVECESMRVQLQETGPPVPAPVSQGSPGQSDAGLSRPAGMVRAIEAWGPQGVVVHDLIGLRRLRSGRFSWDAVTDLAVLEAGDGERPVLEQGQSELKADAVFLDRHARAVRMRGRIVGRLHPQDLARVIGDTPTRAERVAQEPPSQVQAQELLIRLNPAGQIEFVRADGDAQDQVHVVQGTREILGDRITWFQDTGTLKAEPSQDRVQLLRQEDSLIMSRDMVVYRDTGLVVFGGDVRASFRSTSLGQPPGDAAGGPTPASGGSVRRDYRWAFAADRLDVQFEGPEAGRPKAVRFSGAPAVVRGLRSGAETGQAEDVRVETPRGEWDASTEILLLPERSTIRYQNAWVEADRITVDRRAGLTVAQGSVTGAYTADRPLLPDSADRGHPDRGAGAGVWDFRADEVRFRYDPQAVSIRDLDMQGRVLSLHSESEGIDIQGRTAHWTAPEPTPGVPDPAEAAGTGGVSGFAGRTVIEGDPVTLLRGAHDRLTAQRLVLLDGARNVRLEGEVQALLHMPAERVGQLEGDWNLGCDRLDVTLAKQGRGFALDDAVATGSVTVVGGGFECWSEQAVLVRTSVEPPGNDGEPPSPDRVVLSLRGAPARMRRTDASGATLLDAKDDVFHLDLREQELVSEGGYDWDLNRRGLQMPEHGEGDE